MKVVDSIAMDARNEGAKMDRNEPTEVYKDDAGVIRVLATDETVTCSWFALCANDANDVRPHPVLGGVPICSICDAVVENC
jgi:hypothetical protein